MINLNVTHVHNSIDEELNNIVLNLLNPLGRRLSWPVQLMSINTGQSYAASDLSLYFTQSLEDLDRIELLRTENSYQSSAIPLSLKQKSLEYETFNHPLAGNYTIIYWR